MQDLGTLGGNNLNSSEGHDINASGQVTGESFSLDIGSDHAFLWDGMNMLDLNDLIPPGSGWTLSQGNAINDAGQITGSGFIGNQTHAFLLTPMTVTEVPEPGMLMLISTGVIGLSLLRRRQGWTNTARL
jgi:probable HAF family extracellular repeat protein